VINLNLIHGLAKCLDCWKQVLSVSIKVTAYLEYWLFAVHWKQ